MSSVSEGVTVMTCSSWAGLGVEVEVEVEGGGVCGEVSWGGVR